MRHISVGKGQFIWAVDLNGGIWSTNETTKTWVRMPGIASQVSVGRDGTVWCVNAQDQIFRWNLQTQQWDLIPGSLCQISVYDANTVIGVNCNMEIWFWDASVQGWKQFPGSLKQVSVGASGYHHVWGVDAQGQVWFHRSSAQDAFLINRKNQQLQQQQQQRTTVIHNQPCTPGPHVDVRIGTNVGHARHHHHHHHHHPTQSASGYQVGQSASPQNATGQYTYNG